VSVAHHSSSIGDYFEIYLGAISIIDPEIDPSNASTIELSLAAGVDVTFDYLRSAAGSDINTTQLTTWVAPVITSYASLPPSRHTSAFSTTSATDLSFSTSTTASTTMESRVPSIQGCSLVVTRAKLGLAPNDYVDKITITSRAAILPVLLFNATLLSDTIPHGISWSSGSSSGGPAFSPVAIAVPMGIAVALLTAGAVFYRHRNKRKRRLSQWHTAGLEGTPNYAQMREDASSVSFPASSLNLRLFGSSGWLGRFAPARHRQHQLPLTPIIHSPAMSPEEPRGNPFLAGGFSFGEGAAGVADGMDRRPSMATSYQASEFLRHSSHAPSETDYSSNAHTHHTRTSSTYPSVSAHHTGSSFQSHDAPHLNPYPYPNPLRMQHTGSTGMGTKVESDLLSVTMRDSVDGHGTRNSGELEMRKMKNPFGDDESVGGRRTETDSYSSHASWSTAGRRR